MVKSQSSYTALHAVHSTIIKARSISFQKDTHEMVISLLDKSEYLVSLMLDEEDETDEFERILSTLDAEFPTLFGYLLKSFREGRPP